MANPFDAEELERPIGRVMLSPLRARLVQHVAEDRGISTAAALNLIDNAIRETTRGANLKRVIDHMAHPNFAPAKGGAQLDADIATVFDDQDALGRLMRVLGGDYNGAMLRLFDAVDAVRGDGQPTTLAAVLERTDSKPEDVVHGMQMLEARDEAVMRALEAELAGVPEYRSDNQGRVLLDQGDGGPGGEGASVDVGRAMLDPIERENRLYRMRRAAPGWDGDDGRTMFEQYDRAGLEGGIDMVRTEEVRHAHANAHAKAERVGAQLDAALRKATTKDHQLKALDQELAKLDAARGRLVGEKTKLRPAPERTETKRMLLDAPAAEERPTLSPVIQQRMIDLGRGRPELDYEELRRYVLEAAEPGMPLTLDEWADAGYPSGACAPPAPEPAQTDPGPDLNQRVLDRMHELGRPPSEFPRTLEELLAEDE